MVSRERCPLHYRHHRRDFHRRRALEQQRRLREPRHGQRLLDPNLEQDRLQEQLLQPAECLQREHRRHVRHHHRLRVLHRFPYSSDRVQSDRFQSAMAGNPDWPDACIHRPLCWEYRQALCSD